MQIEERDIDCWILMLTESLLTKMTFLMKIFYKNTIYSELVDKMFEVDSGGIVDNSADS